MNKLVARYADGGILKGTTVDFSAGSETFHVTAPAPDQSWERAEVDVADLKALFFVKDYAGDPDRKDVQHYDCIPDPGERLVEVVFEDGELLVGITPAFHHAESGFYLIPSDPGSNNLRCFIVRSAVSRITYLC